MIKNNYAIISKDKTEDFKKYFKINAKNKEYWKKNKEYIETHKMKIEELEALYKK